MKRFNTTGICVPTRHYMVDISQKVSQIRAMVDRGDYFTINKARQYGKTTILRSLAENLRPSYLVISISFEGWSDSVFNSEEAYCQAFLRHTCQALAADNTPQEQISLWENPDVTTFEALSGLISLQCKAKRLSS